MFYILLFIIFAATILSLLFSADGYINKELQAYGKTIREPWLDRKVVLLYDNNENE